MFLKISTGIRRAAVCIQSPFVADADTMGIIAPGMSAGLFHRTQTLYISVLADIKMVTCAGETPAQVVCSQIMFRITTVRTGGGTVDDDKIDKSNFD